MTDRARLAPPSIALALLAPQAMAWEASTSPDQCRIDAHVADTSVEVTFTPSQGLYAILLERDAGVWPGGAIFSIHFRGADPNRISTDRHFFPGGAANTVGVTDTGFGNVLNGLAAGGMADIEFDGSVAAAIPLDGAAPAVAAFRLCTAAKVV